MIGLLGSIVAFADPAATPVDVPAPFELVTSLRYAGSSEGGGLVEGGERVAERRVRRDDLDLVAEFSPFEGVAATLGLALSPTLRYGYSNARSMVLEPVTGGGSYLDGDPSDPVEIRAGGIRGLWLGGAVAPFSETYDKGQRSSWRLDAAVRTPSAGRNLWTTRNGRRGPSPGGAAVRLASTFSTTRGNATPWLRATYQREGGFSATIRDEDDTQWARNVALRPASTADVVMGVRVGAGRVTEADTGVELDLWLGGQYRSWEDIASGVYLPNVLDGARSIPVTTDDQIAATAGFAVDVDVRSAARTRLGLEARYGTPYRLEHVYDVSTTADTWRLGWFVQVDGRLSLKR
ncbi:MAG: hypothetical protein KTR31_21750 [Myxococcales bacterium]|nr:hypothetical protein [Myxococcales bacterium]